MAELRYSWPAMVLHWLMALLIAGNVAYGLAMQSSDGLAKFTRFQMHKSLGVTLLLLIVARTAWRLYRRPPPNPELAFWERELAGAVHAALYAMLFAMPLLGWLAVSASPLSLPTLLFRGWGFPGLLWPHIPGLAGLPMEQRRMVEADAELAHRILSFALYALVLLHLAGVLKHTLIDRRPALARMLPRRPPIRM